jgi:hypothetical protein
MMKVYIVLERNSNTDYDYCGVYKTQEQAEKRIQEIAKDCPPIKEALYIQEEELRDD